MEKRLAGLIVLLLLMLGGCTGEENPNDKPVPVPPASMFMERSYHFCSDEQKDRFLLGYFGTELPDNDIHFFIVSFQNDTLFKEEWPARQMVPEGQEALPETIHESMRKFIDVVPAKGLAGPTTGPGFAFRIGEQQRKIAFCRESKRVVEI